MWRVFKLQLHDAIYRLRFYSNSLTHILLLSNSHNDVASIQKNRGDKSHSVIVALDRQIGMEPLVIDWAKEEAKMRESFVIFMFIANNSIFKSII